MTDTVVVACRVRPLLPHEPCTSIATVALTGKKQLVVGGRRVFSFDDVLSPTDTTQHIFDRQIRPLVTGFVAGYNATVMAYGQTGSGKTHTTLEAAPMILQSLIEGDEPLCRLSELSFSYIEVYGDNLYDLLDPSKQTKPLQLFDGGASPPHKDAAMNLGGCGTYVPGATRATAASIEEALWLLNHGAATRATAMTTMNDNSSRSHAIFTIYNMRFQCKFHIVDLAGSERNKRTNNVGVRFQESISINSGLLALGNVIRALAKNRSHVPYRECKLTRLLQDSLGGNSKTLFVACVAPNKINIDETTRTLQYACRAMQILNEPVPNIDVIAAQQEKALVEQQHANNLSCNEALEADDAFVAEQAAEIRRLTEKNAVLERRLDAAETDLRKDEVVFGEKLQRIGQLEQALRVATQRVLELESVLSLRQGSAARRPAASENSNSNSNSDNKKEPAAAATAVTAPTGAARPSGAWASAPRNAVEIRRPSDGSARKPSESHSSGSSNFVSPSPSRALHDQTSTLAGRYEGTCDYVLPFTGDVRNGVDAARGATAGGPTGTSPRARAGAYPVVPSGGMPLGHHTPSKKLDFDGSSLLSGGLNEPSGSANGHSDSGGSSGPRGHQPPQQHSLLENSPDAEGDAAVSAGTPRLRPETAAYVSHQGTSSSHVSTARTATARTEGPQRSPRWAHDANDPHFVQIDGHNVTAEILSHQVSRQQQAFRDPLVAQHVLAREESERAADIERHGNALLRLRLETLEAEQLQLKAENNSLRGELRDINQLLIA